MKFVIFISLLFIACQQKQSKNQKYRLVTIKESYNIMMNRNEKERTVDTFFAISDEAAFDTAVSRMFALQVAEQVVIDAFEEKGKKDQAKYFATKPISVTAYDKFDIDVSLNINDSVKKEIIENYKINF